MKRPPRAVAAGLAGQLFRAVPYRYRFATALAVSRFLPFVRRFRTPFEKEADTRARVVMRTLTYANVRFPNPIEVRGLEQLQGPAVIISVHLFLNALFLRAVVEAGHRLAIVRAVPADPPYLAGSAIPLDNDLLISPTILVRLRGSLANGEVVFINVDDEKPTRWQMHGLSLSSAAASFARRLGVPLFFAATRMANGHVVAELRRANGKTVDEVMEELKDFLTVADRT